MSSYKIGQIDVLHQDNVRPTHGEPRSPSHTILKLGYRRTEKSRPILVETIFESDQILTVRDGVTLRADVFRSVTDDKVPAIIMYGPYGKSGSGVYPNNLRERVFRISH
jgi:predicted acyl esterase